MKYPLRVVNRPNTVPRVAIVDAAGKVICAMMDEEWGHTFADFIVRFVNLAPCARWFRPHTREDWEWERNSASQQVNVGPTGMYFGPWHDTCDDEVRERNDARRDAWLKWRNDKAQSS